MSSARDRYILLKKNMENQILVITLGELREKLEMLEEGHLRNFMRIWYGKYPGSDPIRQMNQDEILKSIDMVDRTLRNYNPVQKALDEVKSALEDING